LLLKTFLIKSSSEAEENKKDNPKEIFYEFFKLFRKIKSKRFFIRRTFKKTGGGKNKVLKNPKPGIIKNLNTHNSCVWRNGAKHKK
jgi:hypothetical protein